MADESVENRDPRSEHSGQSPQDGESGRLDRASDRRRMMIASLLAPPAVMTLGARSARAKKDPSANCTASLAANPHASHPCG
jgi:hypothetical protein